MHNFNVLTVATYYFRGNGLLPASVAPTINSSLLYQSMFSQDTFSSIFYDNHRESVIEKLLNAVYS